MGPSHKHGVGVFAVEDIKEGERGISLNENPKIGSVLELPRESLDGLPEYVMDMIKSFFTFPILECHKVQ